MDQSIFALYKNFWVQMNSNSLCHVYIKCWYMDKHLFKKCAKRHTRHTVNCYNLPWRALAVSWLVTDSRKEHSIRRKKTRYLRGHTFYADIILEKDKKKKDMWGNEPCAIHAISSDTTSKIWYKMFRMHASSHSHKSECE